MPINIKDHYWRVADDDTRVYSSATGDYVPVANAAYKAWVEAGGLTTNIDTEASLGDVLAPYAQRPVHAGVLDGYKDSQAAKLTIETAAKILFNHENRLRALEGSQPATANQFKTAIKALM